MTVAGEGTMLGLSGEIELQWDRVFLKSRLELKCLDPKLQVSAEPLPSFNLQGVSLYVISSVTVVAKIKGIRL